MEFENRCKVCLTALTTVFSKNASKGKILLTALISIKKMKDGEDEIFKRCFGVRVLANKMRIFVLLYFYVVYLQEAENTILTIKDTM